MSLTILLLIQSVAVAYALVGGVFLAFSDFIMRSLARTDGVGGIDAMQNINREVFRFVFMTLFLGLAPVSLGLIGLGVFNPDLPGAVTMIIAGLVYLVGCFGVTAAFNVPKNDKLATMEKSTAAARDYWTGVYLPRWTMWNTVRTIACVVASLLLLFGSLSGIAANDMA